MTQFYIQYMTSVKLSALFGSRVMSRPSDHETPVGASQDNTVYRNIDEMW